MSISSEITRISGNVSSALTAISNKGVTVPSGSNSDDLATLIGQISGGGGTIIVPEQTMTVSQESTVIPNYTDVLEVGEQYILTVNGDSVTKTAASLYGSVATISYNNNIFVENYGGIMYLTIDSSSLYGSYTIKVEKVGGGGSTLITKTITANGTYSAEDDDADGYSEVTVNVVPTTKVIVPLQTVTASSSATYIQFNEGFVEGESYIVTINGESKNIVCIRTNNSYELYFTQQIEVIWIYGDMLFYLDSSSLYGTYNVKVEQETGGGGSTLITKTITANGTYDAEDDDADGYSSVTVAIPSGTAGTPTATKGSVSNHSISVTPSVTNTAGVISGGTINGTAVTVSASELVSGSETKTANGTYDVTNLASLVVNVSGGSGIGTLLNTTSLGSISSSSTQAASLNISLEVSGINSYDLLIVESSVNSTTNNRHTATVGVIFLTAGSSIGTKNGATIATAKWNSKLSSQGATTTSVSTTAYGIYPNSCSISNGTATIPMYRRYNSTSTGTINGTYTARVYGVNLYDLIGG